MGVAAAWPTNFPPSAATDYTDPNTYLDRNITFSFEQSVQGTGYFMTYKYAKMGNVEFKDYGHGSGSLDSEAILSAYSDNRSIHMPYGDWNDIAQSCIQYKETSKMTYAPMQIAIGNGYYATNPLRYDSLLKEKTWIKNRRASTSMEHEVEYAHAIDKDLNVVGKEKINVTYDPIQEGIGVTQMKITEDVTSGKIHIGVLQGSVDTISNLPASTLTTAPGTNWMAWKKPAIDIDEDYFGTYHIEKNMTIEVPYKKSILSYDWLPCCSGGWEDMYYYDQKGYGSSTKGIFDCSCYKVPTQAQFQGQ
jgi:hypothetical protein